MFRSLWRNTIQTVDDMPSGNWAKVGSFSCICDITSIKCMSIWERLLLNKPERKTKVRYCNIRMQKISCTINFGNIQWLQYNQLYFNASSFPHKGFQCTLLSTFLNYILFIHLLFCFRLKLTWLIFISLFVFRFILNEIKRIQGHWKILTQWSSSCVGMDCTWRGGYFSSTPSASDCKNKSS